MCNNKLILFTFCVFVWNDSENVLFLQIIFFDDLSNMNQFDEGN